MFTQLQEFERRLDGDLILPPDAPAFCAAVLRRLDFVFVGRPSVVPGMVVAGGVLTDGTPVSGAGRGRIGALIRLAGEAAEQLGLRAAVDGLPQDQNVPVLDWHGSRTGNLDRDVLPLSSFETAGYSEGLAAHGTFSDAVQHGALELFERDAAAHWWAGASKPNSTPFSKYSGAPSASRCSSGRSRRKKLVQPPSSQLTLAEYGTKPSVRRLSCHVPGVPSRENAWSEGHSPAHWLPCSKMCRPPRLSCQSV